MAKRMSENRGPVVPTVEEVRAAMALLNAAVEAESKEESAERFDDFLYHAERSGQFTEAAFAAVQALQDFGTIDRAEAACLFHELYDCRSERLEARDPAARRSLIAWGNAMTRDARAGEDAPAAAAAQELAYEGHLADCRAVEAEFHRVRGEEALAEMIVTRHADHAALCSDGEFSLVDDKGYSAPPLMWPAEPKTTAAIAERILSFAAIENVREARGRWEELHGGVPEEDTTSAIRAVQNLRQLALITESEAAHLIDSYLEWTWVLALGVDREHARLRRAQEAIEKAHGLGPTAGFPDGEEPFEWRVLEAQCDRRTAAIAAFWLRRYGEHRMARLIVEDRENYDRLVEEGGNSMCKVRPESESEDS